MLLVQITNMFCNHQNTLNKGDCNLGPTSQIMNKPHPSCKEEIEPKLSHMKHEPQFGILPQHWIQQREYVCSPGTRFPPTNVQQPLLCWRIYDLTLTPCDPITYIDRKYMKFRKYPQSLLILCFLILVNIIFFSW